MFSKKDQPVHLIAKSTFKSSSPLLALTRQFAFIVPLFQQLLGNVFTRYRSHQVEQICQKLPKSIERNKHLANQLQLCEQLKHSLEHFLQPRKKWKEKPYSIYLLWKRLEEIVVNRIKGGVGVFSCHNADHLTLFAFIEDIEEVTECLQEWTFQNKKKLGEESNPSVSFVYPKGPSKTDTQTNRITSESTAVISGKLSKYDRGSTFEQVNNICHNENNYNNYISCNPKSSLSRHFKNNRNSEVVLLRASTAKLDRKPLKISTRCPSAVHLLKNKQYKKPEFRHQKKKKTRFRTKNFTTQVQKENDEFDLFLSNEQPNNQKNIYKMSFVNQSSQKINFSDSSDQQDNQLNVSILQREFEEGNPSEKSDLLAPGGKESKKKKVQINSQNDIESIHQKDSFENMESVECLGQERSEHNNNQSQRSIEKSEDQIILTGENKSNRMDSNRSVSSSNSDCIDPNLEFKIKNKRVLLKKARRSGQFFIETDLQQIKEKQSLPQTKKSIPNNPKTTSRRRLVIISTKSLTKKDLQEQDLELNRENRIIEFEENVLLAAGANQRRLPLNEQRSSKKFKAAASFNSFFGELNSFLEREKFKAQENYGSIFFRQQQKIQRNEDAVMKEKLKYLMKDNHQLFSNIFEMNCKTSENKDVIYSQMLRNQAFECDNDWIRNKNNSKIEEQTLVVQQSF